LFSYVLLPKTPKPREVILKYFKDKCLRVKFKVFNFNMIGGGNLNKYVSSSLTKIIS